MILVDSNVPMYLVGAHHPHKVDAQQALERLVQDEKRLVTDTEVLQEIMHRYSAIDRREAIQPAFDALLGVVDEVLTIDLAVIDRAKDLVLGNLDVSARDAIHAAVMQIYNLEAVLSFDRDFDRLPGIHRIAR